MGRLYGITESIYIKINGSLHPEVYQNTLLRTLSVFYSCLLIKTVKLILFASKLNKPGILSKMHQHLLNSLINTSYLGCLICIKAGVKMTRWGLSGRLFL